MRRYKRNNKKIIMVIAIAVIVVVILAVIVIPRTVKEQEYQKGIEAIQNQDYVVAKNIFTSLTNDGYKDSENILNYMQLRSAFETYKENVSVTDSYNITNIEEYINSANNFKNSIDDKVINADIVSFSTEVSEFKNTVETQQQKAQEEKEKSLQEIVDIVNTDDANTDDGNVFSGAYQAIKELERRYGLELVQYANAFPGSDAAQMRVVKSTSGTVDEDIRALYLYYTHQYGMKRINVFENTAKYFGKDYESYKESTISDYNAIMDSEAERDVIAGISPDYNGFLSDEIVTYCLDYFGSAEEWQTKHNAYMEQESKMLDAPRQKEKPEIGMTEAEVYKTTWGLPEKKNTTTTSGGKSEQWVYSDNRYVYLDNGIVTAIQE